VSIEWDQQGILRPVVFLLHLAMGLALSIRKFELPAGKTMPYQEQEIYILRFFSCRTSW